MTPAIAPAAVRRGKVSRQAVGQRREIARTWPVPRGRQDQRPAATAITPFASGRARAPMQMVLRTGCSRSAGRKRIQRYGRRIALQFRASGATATTASASVRAATTQSRALDRMFRPADRTRATLRELAPAPPIVLRFVVAPPRALRRLLRDLGRRIADSAQVRSAAHPLSDPT